MSGSTLLIHMTAAELQAEISKNITDAIRSAIPKLAEPQTPPVERPVSFNAICEFLGISSRTGREWLREKKIPRHSLGGKFYFFPSEVSHLIKSNSSLTADQIAARATELSSRKSKRA